MWLQTPSSSQSRRPFTRIRELHHRQPIGGSRLNPPWPSPPNERQTWTTTKRQPERQPTPSVPMPARTALIAWFFSVSLREVVLVRVRGGSGTRCQPELGE